MSLHILSTNSGAETKAIPGWPTCCTTKASAHVYFDVLDFEGGFRITINHFNPGVMDTQMQEEIHSSSIQAFRLQAEFFQRKEDLSRH